MTLEKMLTARYESLLFQQFENNIRCVEIYVARGRVFLDFLQTGNPARKSCFYRNKQADNEKKHPIIFHPPDDEKKDLSKFPLLYFIFRTRFLFQLNKYKKDLFSASVLFCYYKGKKCKKNGGKSSSPFSLSSEKLKTEKQPVNCQLVFCQYFLLISLAPIYS